MNKVFLYLYPIEEFTKLFDLGNEYYDEIGVRRLFEVLNETIKKDIEIMGIKLHMQFIQIKKFMVFYHSQMIK